MKKVVHAAAGSLALLLVSCFLLATIASELSMDVGNVVLAKTAILYGIFILIPAMMIAGGSGFSLASGRAGPVIGTKKKRMRLIAANGAMVMLPSAIWLYWSATQGAFGASFMIVQAVELAGGVLQFYLLAKNFHDGLRISGRLRRRPAVRSAGS